MKRFEPSPTASIYSKAIELQKSGVHVYNFAAGDPVLPNHPRILEAAREALGKSPYGPVAGLPELRKAATDWMNRRAKSSYAVDQTIVTSGGKFALFAALQSLLDEGDEVLIPAPYWVSYPEMVRLARGVPKIIPLTEEGGWKLTPEHLRAHKIERTKALLFNNPSNPTGVVYTKEEVQALMHTAEELGLFVIADEVYSELVFDKIPFTSCAAFGSDRLLVVESCSKNFGMAGWRVGFAFGSKELIAQMTAFQSQSTTGACFISQKAALATLAHADEVAAYVREAMDRRRKLFFDTYNRLFHKEEPLPPAAIYHFAKVDTSSTAFCEEALAAAHVALVPGIAFGKEGYIRFAFSEEEDEIVGGLVALASRD